MDGVSFSVSTGATLGLVGESGCGKTTTSRCVLRAIPASSGQIIFHDEAMGPVDVVNADKETLRKLRLNMQMIFQDPFSSLNPRMTLLDIVGEPLVINKVARGREVEERVAELLRRVGLRPEYMRRYPHAFSGGQRQRIGIARALALNPRLVVADEPVSALDVSIQAQTLNLLQDLQEEFDLSYIFVAHDLSVVQHISDYVAVMYVGKLVEYADNERIFFSPQHPYTEALLSSVRRPDPLSRTRTNRPRRRRAGSRQPTKRLLLPSALPIRRGDLPCRDAAATRNRNRSLRRLSLFRGVDAAWSGVKKMRRNASMSLNLTLADI